MKSDIRKENIFSRNRSVNFLLFDKEFATGLRSLVLFRHTQGGLPAGFSRYEGFPVGEWLWSQRRNPHSLGDAERACLLAVPGVYIGAGDCRPDAESDTRSQRAKDLLWSRLIVWAHDPMDDPLVETAVFADKERAVKAEEAILESMERARLSTLARKN